MSELINQNHRTTRWQLLTTVSALSLAVTLSAHAETSDKPTVWIELGGQLERIEGLDDPQLAPFTTKGGPFNVMPAWQAEKPSIFSYGAEGKITLEPEGSQWTVSASVRYGRSNNDKHIHQQSNIYTHYANTKFHGTAGVPAFKTKSEAVYADFRVKNHESHAIVDFEVGRDVGLGWLSSVASFGIRMADFASGSHVNSIARPQAAFKKNKLGLNKYLIRPFETRFTSVSDDEHGFKGIGPSLSLEGHIPVLGGEKRTITFDWGANAAALFGRQTAKGSHQTTALFYDQQVAVANTVPPYYGQVLLYRHPFAHNRSRSIIVPNVGGLAGISFRYAAAKVSLGYRADFFFGAMDEGVDVRDAKDRNFYGPFATISIGLP